MAMLKILHFQLFVIDFFLFKFLYNTIQDFFFSRRILLVFDGQLLIILIFNNSYLLYRLNNNFGVIIADLISVHILD